MILVGKGLNGDEGENSKQDNVGQFTCIVPYAGAFHVIRFAESGETACTMAKQAFEEAFSELGSVT